MDTSGDGDNVRFNYCNRCDRFFLIHFTNEAAESFQY